MFVLKLLFNPWCNYALRHFTVNRVLRSRARGLEANAVLPSLPSIVPDAMQFNRLANWVVPGHILVGRYPLMDDTEYREHLEQVVASGVQTFICLQAELPPQDAPAWTPEGIQLERRRFLPYAPVAKALAAGPLAFLYESIGTSSDLSRERLVALVENLVDRILANEVLYIHCWGGRGRTGMIASCVVGRLYNLTADEAMSLVDLGYETRKFNSPHHVMTGEHREFVRWFLRSHPYRITASVQHPV
eukprot:gnl/TRDRNA2_/TRDRNA2_207565_c0_seq1.p1 gnl/TRDRNA2_/TRDRNA2_207565_c0~~gnl/TRDRNA2_/TRDRNA2_207565_c0_seq1.p1  ORF type:complete len:246 (-),score=16.14 gnl/TRDRNA2_/TRDRNA2_207565_c0_seq1:141-878(-)